MKALLILFLAVNCLAVQPEVLSFFKGFQRGLERAQSCSTDPVACGKHVGSVVTMLNDHHRGKGLQTTITKQMIQDFLTGLVTGLRLDNSTTSACVSDFQQGISGFSTLYADVINFNPHNINPLQVVDFVCSGTGFLFLDYWGDCHFNTLWDDLTDLDIQLLIKNYLDNLCPLNTAFVNIYNCWSNPTACGYGVGFSIRSLLLWGI